jgi:hypothetical protein
LGGRAILVYYRGSVSLMVASVYKEFEWLPWKFKRTPKEFWKDPKNCKLFFEWSKSILSAKYGQDWMNVSTKDLIDLGGPRISVKEFLKRIDE